MTRVKIDLHAYNDVEYSEEHWNLLKNLRNKAMNVMEILEKRNFHPLCYGSIARGDVHENSDIDIVLKNRVPSYQLELMLESISNKITQIKIIQATPNDIIKAHYELEDNVTITLLLTKIKSNAFEFYKFGGAIDFNKLKNDKRVPGIDKRLVLIKPNSKGHKESPLSEFRYEARKILNISQNMINQRIRILTKRDKKGRTGVFLQKILNPNQNVESELRELSRTNSLLRRSLENG